jgi:hypothetical protein
MELSRTELLLTNSDVTQVSGLASEVHISAGLLQGGLFSHHLQQPEPWKRCVRAASLSNPHGTSCGNVVCVILCTHVPLPEVWGREWNKKERTKRCVRLFRRQRHGHPQDS